MSHTRRSTWSSLAALGPVRRCALLLRSWMRCSWCSVELDYASAQIDHVVPRSQGGTDDNGNLLASCPDCNAPQGTARYSLGRMLRRRVTPELAAVLAAPIDLAAGRTLALEWYPWLPAREADNSRRKRNARMRRHVQSGATDFPFGDNAGAS